MFPFSTEASKQAQLMEVLKKEVRAMLIAAKAGLTPKQLEEQYMAMVCKPLPLRDLGFQSALELVTQMPEVVRVCSSKTGTLILKGEVSFPNEWRSCLEPHTGVKRCPDVQSCMSRFC